VLDGGLQGPERVRVRRCHRAAALDRSRWGGEIESEGRWESWWLGLAAQMRFGSSDRRLVDDTDGSVWHDP
jgi:hypothetical protein